MGAKAKYMIRLKKADRLTLKAMMSKGRHPVRVLKRARVLQLMDAGLVAEDAGQAAGLSDGTARQVAKRYLEGDLASALYERPRPGGERRLNQREGTQIVAMVCAGPPQGYARWSVRLVAQESVRRKVVATVGRETIRLLLKEHDLKPWREKNVVRADAGQRIRRAHGGSSGPV
jgi:putative transposase